KLRALNAILERCLCRDGQEIKREEAWVEPVDMPLPPSITERLVVSPHIGSVGLSGARGAGISGRSVHNSDSHAGPGSSSSSPSNLMLECVPSGERAAFVEDGDLDGGPRRGSKLPVDQATQGSGHGSQRVRAVAQSEGPDLVSRDQHAAQRSREGSLAPSPWFSTGHRRGPDGFNHWNIPPLTEHSQRAVPVGRSADGHPDDSSDFSDSDSDHSSSDSDLPSSELDYSHRSDALSSGPSTAPPPARGPIRCL
ncbi:unnamed protein product, partial [Mycena citricolor]